MKAEVFLFALGLAMLATNYSTMFVTFPRRFNLFVSIAIPVIFVVALQLIWLLTSTQLDILWGWRGLLHFPIILLIFKGKFFQKLYAFFLQMVLSSIIVLSLQYIFEMINIENTETLYLTYFIVLMILFAVYFLLILKFGREFFRKMFIDGRNLDWAIYSIGAMFSFLMLSVVTAISLSPWLKLIILSFVLWSFIILSYTIINAHEKSKQKYEAEFAKNIISCNTEHYEQMDELYTKLKILRHDYHHHLNILENLIRSGNENEISSYIEDMKKEVGDDDFIYYSTDPAINALLSNYVEICEEQNITFNVEIDIPNEIKLSSYEMCIIIGNLLENAVEACKRIASERSIELSIKHITSQLIIMVKNSYDGKVIENNGIPVSRKSDSGFGILSVKELAKKYDGDLLMEWNNEFFTSYVTMVS